MILIILKSNGDPIDNWRVAPGVYLAIASVVANIVLRYTFNKGVEISWWVAALREDGTTTVADLHHIWSFGTSLRSALLAGRGFNLVALAAVLLALVPANAPLAQRASRTVSRPTALNVDAPIVAAPSLNATSGATGMITGRIHQINYITPSFAPVLQDHLLSNPIPLEGSLCRGTTTCRGILQAAGYEMACVDGTEFFDKTPRLSTEIAEDGNSAFNDSVVFSTDFAYMIHARPQKWLAGESIMNLTAKFKEHGWCKGDVAVRNCTMAPATLAYRIVIANGTIALDRDYTYEDDRVIKYAETSEREVHGGVFLALQEMFSAKVTLRFAGAAGYDMTTTGITALRYSRRTEEDTHFLCQNRWLDPTHDILMTARELMFRLALQGNNSDIAAQSVRVAQEGTEVVYTSDFLFLGLALMLICLAAVAVVPLLMHWWRLGRDVSLSPIEIARAFSAPELVGSGSNSDASRLMKDIGAKEVRYGVVSSGGANGYQGQVWSELAFAHPSVVQTPRKGEQY
ncbi:hypothetical protein NW754_002271 [Fusarium falciforme]|uniref:Uncharacterized protein n=1 Tax=Fusarium falciforme TaxID=195108 RepID=A0A9W8UUD1_9HYPO|nr:hypothetical protein NW754_002271 [Fusarium falciforme]KAJ4176498.1 hypothetical protein NW755_014382 [Fusarium falciforme]KAJ4222581.1 hypothetical protein NW757_014411 [Fusarium falciforme]